MAGSLEFATACIIIGSLFVFMTPLFQGAYYPSDLYSDQLRLIELSEGGLQSLLPYLGEDGGGDLNANSPIVLDPDRMAMLDEECPFGYISYEGLKGEMGLDGYDFKATVALPYDVDVQLIESNSTYLKFLVTLKDEQTPISNALVKAYMISIDDEEDSFGVIGNIHISTKSDSTTIQGEAIVDLTIPPWATEDASGDYIVLFQFTVGETTSFIVKYDKSNPNLNIYYFNQEAKITLSPQAEQGAKRITKLLALVGSSLVPLYNTTDPNEEKLNWGARLWWNRTFAGLEDVSILFVGYETGVGVGNIETWIEVGFHYMPLTLQSNGVKYGREPADHRTGSSTVVSIAGLIYELEFILWDT